MDCGEKTLFMEPAPILTSPLLQEVEERRAIVRSAAAATPFFALCLGLVQLLRECTEDPDTVGVFQVKVEV